MSDNGYFHKGEFKFQVEGRCTKSPYEFYGRPLIETIPDEEIFDKGNAMIDANDRLQEFIHELNTFYGDPTNRRLIDQEATYGLYLKLIML
jgi:hypothetical protein